MIDYKGGKVVWDNSHNWMLDDSDYAYEQDILQLKYGDHCVIDVGNYANGKGEGHFVIMVINYAPYHNEEDKPEAWNEPFASIPCKDKTDMLMQLQRAIRIYPEMIG